MAYNLLGNIIQPFPQIYLFSCINTFICSFDLFESHVTLPEVMPKCVVRRCRGGARLKCRFTAHACRIEICKLFNVKAPLCRLIGIT
jgi:hypothetical protein